MEKEIIINKTTVWKTIVQIKKNFIITDKYIDLSKLNRLHIHEINKLFKILRSKLGLSQRKCAKILKLNNVSNYENLNQAISFQKLLELSSMVNFDLYNYLKNNSHKFSFGTSNEIKTELPMMIKDAIKISTILKPSRFKKRNILYLLDNNNNYIIKNFKIYLNKDNKKIIHSALLWNYLNIYFEYKKKSLLEFPLSNIYSELKSNGSSNLTIIGSLLLTEGSKNKQGFNFSNKSKTLHDLFVESIYYKYKILPTTYYNFVGDVYRTYYSSRKALSITQDIENYIGNVQTEPRNKDYFYKKQPSLNFIKTKKDKITLLRIFSVTEGGVYLKLTPYNKPKKEFIVIPEIYFACSHPKLLLDLYNLSLSLGFHPTLRKDKTWSGWAGLIFPSFRDSINFLKIGGFLDEVNVARIDSTFYGIEKQKLLLSILELRKRMLYNKKLRKYNKNQLVNEVIKIIKNRDYNSNYSDYLSLLTSIHNKRELKSERIYELKKDVKLLLNNQIEFIKNRAKLF